MSIHLSSISTRQNKNELIGLPYILIMIYTSWNLNDLDEATVVN